MSRHTADTVITAALRDLDPAPESELTEAERTRADAAFANILATPVDGAVPVEPIAPRRRRTRLLVTAGVAAAGTAVAVPGLLLGGGTAYGSWTPTPEALTAGSAAAAATTCRAALGVPDQGEHVALAERRGDWTYVLLSGPDAETTCLMPNDLVGQDPAAREDFFGTSSADAPAAPTLRPDRIDETTSMDGSTDEGWFTWTEGYVGSDVAGVTVHTSSGLDVEASVRGDRFAAWWPSVEQDSQHPSESWSYTLHLSDGTTRSVS